MTSELLDRNMSTDDELIIIKEFAVPKNLVFKALTEHEDIKKWSSPKNFVVTFSAGKLQVGGVYRYGMQSNKGPEFVMTGEYKEIDPPNKLVYTQTREGSGPETEISIILEEHKGKTTMTFHHYGFPSREFRDGAIHGWNDAFVKLENHLNSLK